MISEEEIREIRREYQERLDRAVKSWERDPNSDEGRWFRSQMVLNDRILHVIDTILR